MTKIRPYIVVAILTLLLAAPWLQTAEAGTVPDETTSGCCQGTPHSCCCCAPSSSDDSKPADDTSGCSCEMSAVPVTPDLPMEFHEYRLTDRSGESISEDPISTHVEAVSGIHAFALDKSPPQILSRPTYVLFSTLLI